MNDSAFDAALDRLVIGHLPEDRDDLTDFVGELYRKEQTVMMPTTLKQQVAQNLGITPAAPVSNRTRRAQAMTPARQRSRWGGMFAVTMAALVALTGIFQLGSDPDRDDRRFGILSPAVPTAEATPAVTDAEAWTLPISSEECAIKDPGELPPAREEDLAGVQRGGYQVIGPANTTDAMAANDMLRQYVACGFIPTLMTEPFAIETSLQSGSFSPTRVVQYHRQLADGIRISGEMTDHGMTLDDVPSLPPGSDSSLMLSNPNSAFALSDGRLLIPMGAFELTDVKYGSGVVIVQENGDWLVDDVIPLCFGNCEGRYAQVVQLGLEYIWLQPIDAEECEGNQFLPEELSEEEIAAIRSRQYRGCELNELETSMQSPTYQLVEGEDARLVSEEIESLLRENNVFAGSLQKSVQNLSGDPDYQLPTDPWIAYQPSTVVTLEDGRIAVLETTVHSSESSSLNSGRTNPVITTALVWQVDGDVYLLEQEVAVCLGSCDAYWSGSSEAENVTPLALVIPETCDTTAGFRADFTSDSRIAVGIRPGPGSGSGVTVATLPAGTPLQYLCEQEPTANPASDRMDEGQVWLKVITEDGTEGWIRENDVQPMD